MPWVANPTAGSSSSILFSSAITPPLSFPQALVLVNRQYGSLGVEKLVRIDRLVKPVLWHLPSEDEQEETQRSIQNSFLHKQVSEQVGLQKIDDFATPPIDYGLHHEKTEALYLVQLNRRRQREFLADGLALGPGGGGLAPAHLPLIRARPQLPPSSRSPGCEGPSRSQACRLLSFRVPRRLAHATHKHPKVQRWLARHPRFNLHFTPASASWLNMVERFFRDLTQNRLRRGVFRDLEELIMAIGTYIDRHNESPKPFIWTARAADILEKVKRARRTLNKRQSA